MIKKLFISLILAFFLQLPVLGSSLFINWNTPVSQISQLWKFSLITEFKNKDYSGIMGMIDFNNTPWDFLALYQNNSLTLIRLSRSLTLTNNASNAEIQSILRVLLQDFGNLYTTKDTSLTTEVHWDLPTQKVRAIYNLDNQDFDIIILKK